MILQIMFILVYLTKIEEHQANEITLFDCYSWDSVEKI